MPDLQLQLACWQPSGAKSSQVNFRGKFMRRYWRIFAATAFIVAILAGLYAKIYSDFWSNEPQIKRNFSAEINAEILKIPEDQRAWPKYRAALLKLKPGLGENSKRNTGRWNSVEMRPGSKAWPEVVSFIDQHQAELSELRAAAKSPHLGYQLADAYTAADSELANAPPGLASQNPQMIAVLLLPQGMLTRAVPLLGADARVASMQNAPARTVEDLTAIIDIACHLQEPPCLLALMRSWQAFEIALQTIDELLETDPLVFSEEQLQVLSNCIAAFCGNCLEVDTSFEKMLLEDIEQRCFTDDGAGDGYLYPIQDGQPHPSFVDKILLPLGKHRIREKMASRREYHDGMVSLFESLDREMKQPPWLVHQFASEDELIRLHDEQRFSLLALMFPKCSVAYFTSQQISLRGDATQLAIALCRYRLRHRAWPNDLSALVPDVLDSIPIDPFDGQPLRYRLDRERPIIYSVGLNAVDDAGRPMTSIARQRLLDLWPSREKLLSEFSVGDLILWPQSKVAEAAKVEAAKEWLLELGDVMTRAPVSVEWDEDEPEVP